MILAENTIAVRNIDSGKVDITDPIYKKDSALRINDIALPSGEYKLTYYTGSKHESDDLEFLRTIHKPRNQQEMQEIVAKDIADIRARVFVIELRNANCKAFPFNSEKWEKIGQIGVDSGIAGIFWNPCEFADENKYDDFFNKVHSNRAVADDNGFYCCSGYGDGMYDVFAVKENGVVVALRADFL